jgi:hypothetical protein
MTRRRGSAAIPAVLAVVLLAAFVPCASGEAPPEGAQAPGSGAKPAGLLDGRSFSGPLLKQGEVKGDPDTVLFRDGRMHSNACQAMGFPDTAYHAGALGAVIRFRVEAKSDTAGTMAWNGTVRDDVLDATISVTRPGAAPVLYSLRATRDRVGGSAGGR